MGDEIIDDGMGGGSSSDMGDAEEVFETEELVPDEDEGFEVDEEPSEEELEAVIAYARENGLVNTCRLILNLNEFVFVD